MAPSAGALTDEQMFGHGEGGGGALTDEQMFGDAPAEQGPSQTEAYLRGSGQGVSLGFSDEIVGALESVLDKIRNRNASMSMRDTYQMHRDESRAANRAAEEAHPLTYETSKFVGGAVPIAAATMATGGTALPAILADAAVMAGSEAVRAAGENEDLDKLPAEMGRAALIGGASGAAGNLAGRALGAVGKRLAPSLQEAADASTLRAAGHMGSDTAKLSPETRAARAEFLREGKFVEPFDTVGHVSEKLQAARQATNEAYGEALGQVDTEAAAHGFTPTHDLEVAQKLRGVLDEAATDPKYSSGATGALRDIIGKLEQRSQPMNLHGEGGLDELRRGLQARTRYKGEEQLAPGSNELMAKAADAVKQHLLDVSAQIGGGAGPEALGGAVQTLLAHSADVTPLAKMAAKRAGGLAGQQGVPLSGKFGLYSGLATAAAGHPVAGAAIALGGIAAKNISQRANAFGGVMLDRLAALAVKNPAKLGRWAGYVAAAAQRGPQALAATHYTLSMNDPQYAEATRAALNESPGESGVDEESGAPSISTSIPVREP